MYGTAVPLAAALVAFLGWVTLYPYFRRRELTAPPAPALPELPAVRFGRIGAAVEFTEADRIVLLLRTFGKAATLGQALGDRDVIGADIQRALDEFDARFFTPSLKRREAALAAPGERSGDDTPRDVLAAMLQGKPAAKEFRAIETHVLDNGKHVAELYDADGNRLELMEPPRGVQ